MAILPLSYSRHQHLRWSPFTSYAYASERHLVGLAAAEIGMAALAFPLTFVQQDEQWSLCGLLGLVPGQNLYVSLDGNWAATYVPAVLRGHPFHLGWEKADASLCVDEDSGLLSLDGNGSPVFDEAGNLSEPVSKVWDFLSSAAEGVLRLEEACRVLSTSGVFEPWPIAIQDADGTRTIDGYYRINESALNNLSDIDFGYLRRSGVIGVAYAQLLSMSNISNLGKLAQVRAETIAQVEAAERRVADSTPLIKLPDDSTIDWDWSKVGKS